MAKRYRRRRKHRLAAPIGGAFLLLAAIGVATIIILSLQLTGSVLNNQRQKESFEQLIRPVVMFDPVPFETAENISNTNLLLYSMWSALSNKSYNLGENQAYYDIGASQEYLVPASDLNAAAQRLFGGAVALEHGHFGDFDVQYYYDAEKNMYNVPMTAELYVYTPRVTDIVKDGEFYNLTVDYVPPGSAWTATLGGVASEPVADKTMIYVMSNQKDGWHIVKVRDLPNALINPLQIPQS